MTPSRTSPSPLPTSPPPIAAEEIISGERLQTIADVTVMTESKAAYHSSCPPMKLAHFAEGLAPNEQGLAALKEARVIFVYAEMIRDFAANLLPRLEKPIVLITHNGDTSIDGEYSALLDDPHLLHWYGQNARLKHPKLTALPIGIGNAQWKHGNIRALAKVAARPHRQMSGLYVNFEVGTNPSVRGPLLTALRSKPFCIMGGSKRSWLSYAAEAKAAVQGKPYTVKPAPLPYPLYLADMAQWRFCVSPPGNGIDCHRTWEALYLGVIPVVMPSVADLLDDLPCIVRDDIASLSLETLESARQELIGPFAWDKLKLSRWRKTIRAHRT
jgi:hypothetical protein